MESGHRENRRSDRRDSPIAPEGVIEASELFGARDVIEIRHNGQTYRLRITRSGKLILNK